MKKLLILLVFVLSLQLVSADVILTVNSVESGDLELVPGETLSILTQVQPDTYIDKIDVSSSNVFLDYLINIQLEQFSNVNRVDKVQELDQQITLPETLPSGEHSVDVTFYYVDSMLQEQSHSVSYTVIIPDTGEQSKLVSALINRLPKDAAYLIAAQIYDIQLESIPRELTQEELLKLTGDANAQATKVTESSQEQDITAYEDANTDVEGVQEAVDFLEKESQPMIEKELHVYNVTLADGSTQTISKIIIRVSHTDPLSDLVVVEEIPKVVAADVSEMKLRERPEVLLADPIVKWQFDHVPEGQTKEFSYTVPKELDSVESVSVAAGSEPSAFAVWLANLIQKMIGTGE
jgi:archaellin